MTGIYLEDGTSIHFLQDEYTIHFEGMSVMFLRKSELKPSHRRNSKIVLDYENKTAYFEWSDGHNETMRFEGMI